MHWYYEHLLAYVLFVGLTVTYDLLSILYLATTYVYVGYRLSIHIRRF